MVSIKVGGRELALDFTIEAMDLMERALGTPVDLANLKETVVNRTAERKPLIAIVSALAQAAGEDIATPEWLAKHIRPRQLLALRRAALEAMTEGMLMETEQPEADEEVDVVLEEIKKNEAGAD